jgi:PPM family protein phosphatase
MTPDRATDGAPTLHWSGVSDRGRVRPNNEDSFLGLQFDAREVHRLGKHGSGALTHTDYVFAVSDGMGGALAGEYASKIAVEKITTLLPRAFKLSAQGLASGFSDVLIELYDQIHRAIVFLGNSYEECSGMETTLSLCWFTPGWMYYAHVGDSRIYSLPAKEDRFKQLSQDDTYVGWLFRNGKLNEYQARTHPQRNVLQKALGGGNRYVEPQVGAVGYEPGDMFLICSDGLVDGLFDDRVAEFLRAQRGTDEKSFAGTARQLVDAALDGGSRDNTTALAIRAI